MESIWRLHGITAVGIMLALLLLPTVALTELATWDQERVTQIAEEFAGAMKALRKEMQAAPPMTDPSRQRALYVALDDIRIMTNTSTLLANKLKAGEDREQTFAAWRRLDLLRRDFEENARKADIEGAIMDKILTAGELLIRLTPYYRSEEEASG
jgi:hypothetical protein